MLRYLLIGPAYPFRGGIANFNEALCRSLSSSGHSSEIVSFTLQYPSLLFPGKTQFEKGAPPGDINIKRIINPLNPFSWFKTAAYAAKLHPCCLIVHYWLPFFAPAYGFILRRLKKRFNVKIIGLVHNVDPHDRFPLAKRFTRYFLKGCDGFVVMSESVKQDIENLGINRPSVCVPHPVYDTFGKAVDKKDACSFLKLDPAKRYILFFGIVRKYKGLDLLLKALSDERLKDMNVNLIVAGEFYEDPDYYKQMVRDLNLKGKVGFTEGFVPKEKVKYYFCSADMVVQPYRSATQSGVTQIAYHFARPMLVTGVGGLPGMVPDGRVGYVTNPSPVEIADAIYDFYINEREKEFTENVEIERKRFTWDAMVEGIESLTCQIEGKE